MNVVLMVIQRKKNESYVEYEEKERYREMMREKEKKDRGERRRNNINLQHPE